MGVYWATHAYAGRLLSAEALARLRASPEAASLPGGIESWLEPTGDPRGWAVLRAPGAWVQLGNVDPALEEHEVRAGAVARAELERALGGRAASVLELDPAASERLRALVKAAAPPDAAASAEPGVYVIEAEWWSSEGHARVRNNIRVQ